MKQLCFTAFILLAAHFSIAQDKHKTVIDDNSPKIGKIHFIRDYIQVPLRSGQSSQHRIIHRGLISGQTVTLLEVNKESGFSKIKTTKGTEGWLPSQYLMETPTAAIRLKQAKATIAKLKQKAGPMGEQLLQSQKENQKLTSELQQLTNAQQQLEEDFNNLKAISTNAINLDNENKALLHQNESLKNKHDTLTAENQHLESQLMNESFINGALVLFAGMILTLIVQHFAQSRKKSDWG